MNDHELRGVSENPVTVPIDIPPQILRWRNARLIFSTVTPFPLTLATAACLSDDPRESFFLLFISSLLMGGYVVASLAAIALAIEHYILNSLASVFVVALFGGILVAAVPCLIGATFITIPAILAGSLTYLAVAVNYRLSVSCHTPNPKPTAEAK